jgi:Spy/CpxP family protein refolding chaperone
VLIRFFALPLLAGSLIAGSAGAFAQTAPQAPAAAPAGDASPAPDMAAPHHHRNKMMAALSELNLSDDQKAKIKGFMTSFREAHDSATPETRKQLREQVEGVLTPDQRGQFEAQMKHRMQPATAPAS